MITSTKV